MSPYQKQKCKTRGVDAGSHFPFYSSKQCNGRESRDQRYSEASTLCGLINHSQYKFRIGGKKKLSLSPKKCLIDMLTIGKTETRVSLKSPSRNSSPKIKTQLQKNQTPIPIPIPIPRSHLLSGNRFQSNRMLRRRRRRRRQRVGRAKSWCPEELRVAIS